MDFFTLWRQGKPGGLVSEGRSLSSGAGLKDVASFSSVAVMRVVRVPGASTTSRKVCPYSSSDDRRSGGCWGLFLILVMDPFFVGFIHVFSLGVIVLNSIVQKKLKICKV